MSHPARQHVERDAEPLVSRWRRQSIPPLGRPEASARDRLLRPIVASGVSQLAGCGKGDCVNGIGSLGFAMVTAAVTIARPQTDGKHSDRPRWDVGTSWGLCRRCAGALITAP